MNFRELFFFDSMVTPKVINLLYWAKLALVTLLGLFAAFSMLAMGQVFGFLMVLVAVAVALVVTRIWCELLIVLFKINGNLQKLADNASSTPTDSSL